MRRGRKPKTAHDHLLNGNPSKKVTLTDNLPTYDAAQTNPPRWLSAVAKSYWRRVAPMLSDNGVMTQADVETFAMLCESYADYRDATATLRRDGQTFANANGNIIKHPAVNIQKDAADRFSRLAREFGLTPASRSAVKTQTNDDDPDTDDLAKYLGAA